jgi:hypothetical protein
MDDFWGPFYFGVSWLALALIVLWLLGRAPQHHLSLRSDLARGLGWSTAVLALLIFVTGMPFSLGFCRGGFDDPLTCSILPVTMVERTYALTLLLTITGIFVTPILAAAVIVLEGLKRR